MQELTARLSRFANLYGLGSYLKSARLIEIDGVVVDTENIVWRRYRCDGSICLHRTPDGQWVGDCCHGAEIWLDASEQEQLLAHLPGILPFMLPGYRQAIEARLRRYRHDPAQAFCRPMPVLGQRAGDAIMRHERGGCCPFRTIALEGGHRAVRCAIHAYLLSAGLPLWEVKPVACWAWPLTLQPLMDGRVLVTLHTPDTRSFTGEGAYHASRPCLCVQPPDAPPVYQAIEQELRRLLGDRFYDKLLAAISAGVALPEPGQAV